MILSYQDTLLRTFSRFLRIGWTAFTPREFFEATHPTMTGRKTASAQDELYNPRKAAQIIAFFAIKQGARAIEIVKAIKLLYLADRESLRRWGVPLLHEPRASLRLGPVNQTTLDYVNGHRSDADAWATIIGPRNDSHIPIQPGVVAEDLDEFSGAELDVLEDIWEKHGQFKSFQIVDWTHNPANVPEWTEPLGPRKSTPIELIDILRAVGFPDPDAALDRIESQRNIERSFRGLR